MAVLGFKLFLETVFVSEWLYNIHFYEINWGQYFGKARTLFYPFHNKLWYVFLLLNPANFSWAWMCWFWIGHFWWQLFSQWTCLTVSCKWMYLELCDCGECWFKKIQHELNPAIQLFVFFIKNVQHAVQSFCLSPKNRLCHIPLM